MGYGFRRAVILVALLLPAGGWAAATEGKSGTEERMQEMIGEIRKLLDRAEEKREADPWLIRDLREVLAKYAFPWTRTVYTSDFSRKRKSPPSPWRVASGTFRVTERGLHSIVVPPDDSGGPEEGETTQKKEGDQVRDLFGAILEEALRERDEGTSTPSEEPTEPRAARALLPERTGNSFAVRLAFSAEKSKSAGEEWAFGPYQGEQGETGYRLVIRPRAGEEKVELELVKRGPRGTESTIALQDTPLQAADGEPHSLVWTRNRQGRMEIDLDGESVFDVTDRGFRDPFAGFVVRNAGGDFAIGSLVIKDENGN